MSRRDGEGEAVTIGGGIGLPSARPAQGKLYAVREEDNSDIKVKSSFWEIRKAAKEGDPEAQYLLGVRIQRGRRAEKEREASVWYRKAAEQGHAEAQAKLGDYCAHRLYDMEQALMWLEKAAVQNNERATSTIAHMAFRGNPEAVNLLTRLAERGYAKAQANLGVLYVGGYGVEQDNEKAFMWLEKAATQNEWKVSYFFRLAREGNAEAINFLVHAVEHGDAREQCELGFMYLNGERVRKNIREALKWLEKAAGPCGFGDMNVRASNSAAKTLFRLAKQGNEDAFNCLCRACERCMREANGASADDSASRIWVFGGAWNVLRFAKSPHNLKIAEKVAEFAGGGKQEVVGWLHNLSHTDARAKFLLSEIGKLLLPESEEFGDELKTELSRVNQEYAQAVPERKERVVQVIERGPIGDWVKARRNHKCQVCEALGVDYGFLKADGGRYAEAHHVDPVSVGGSLGPENIVALCATHHRQMHYGDAVLVRKTGGEFIFRIDGKEISLRRFSPDE